MGRVTTMLRTTAHKTVRRSGEVTRSTTIVESAGVTAPAVPGAPMPQTATTTARALMGSATATQDTQEVHIAQQTHVTLQKTPYNTND